MGYHQSGFEVVGVDIEPQPRYPFEFIQVNALEYITQHGHEFDVIHSSPPCQPYSTLAALSNGTHLELIEPTRAALLATGKPYVIENVLGSPLVNPIMLCGTMFGLGVIRHRLFETSPVFWWPPSQCQHIGKATGAHSTKGNGTNSIKNHGFTYVTVVGNDYLADEGREAMDIDWMIKLELSQAVPPAYTKWLGDQLLSKLRQEQP